MSRRATGALAAALALGLLAPGAASALDLAPAGTARFPERAFALTLPSPRPLVDEQVVVRENGRPVSEASVVPGTAAGPRELGILLAIDASTSMRGEAIDGAMEAARTLAARRNPDQRLGVVIFHGGVATLLRPTSDAAKIEAALASVPELDVGTRVYDAVYSSIDVLARAGISGGSVVVLSDGDDVGSRRSAADIGAAARAEGVRIYSVGLRSHDFDPVPLQEIAAAGRGSYSEAGSPAQLREIYDHLGTQLASQYLIRYRSAAGPRKRVHVAVAVEGVPGVAAAEYTTPALRLPASPPFERPLEETFWRSEAAIVVVSVVAACLLWLGLMVLLRPRSRTRTLRKRLDAFVSPADQREAPLTAAAGRVLVRTERSLERTSWWPAVKQEIEVARIPVAPVQLVALTVMGTVFAVWALTTLTGSVVGGIAGLATPALVWAAVRIKLAYERNRFADQLADHLQVVASALRAGHSFAGALAVANQDAPEPLRREFERVVADERLGAPLEEALDAITERMASPDVPHIALVAKLQRQTGANAAEVLDRVVATIRVRQELRRHVRAITAQQRLARWVLTALPIGLLLSLLLLNSEYIQPLFDEPVGRVMLVFAMLGMVLGSLLLKRISDIEV